MMNKNNKIEKNLDWILFDFGGTIDSDGVHSRRLFYDSFIDAGMSPEIKWEQFQDAYTFADRLCLSDSLLLNKNLKEMNIIMVELILTKIEGTFFGAADKITLNQDFYLKRNVSILKKLSLKYKLGVISNFTGNLRCILEEYKYIDLFDFVIDSFYTNFLKPQKEIFELALSKTNVDPKHCLYIGDNPQRDILPAKQLGFNTLLITAQKKSNDQLVIYSLEELPRTILNQTF